MKVLELMSQVPVFADAYEKVQTAGELMREHVIGALPVVEQGRLVGIVTDRDLATRVVAGGRAPWETYIREVMTPRPATCRAEEPISAAIERMIARRVRRLVVTDADGKIRGVLSTDDLLLCEETQFLAGRVLIEIARARGELNGMFAPVQP